MCMFTAKRSASVVHSFNIGTRKPLNSITVQAKMHDAMNSIYIPLKGNWVVLSGYALEVYML